LKLQRAAKLLVEQRVKGLQRSMIARKTRRWLRSAKRQDDDQRPIARLQNPERQVRYSSYRYMFKFVFYFLRITADEGKMSAYPLHIPSSYNSGKVGLFVINKRQ
jgi:hypothetical protein